jgi:hypothetical protein
MIMDRHSAFLFLKSLNPTSTNLRNIYMQPITEDDSMSEKISSQELKAGKTIINGIIQDVHEIIDTLEPHLPPDVLAS